MSISEMFTDAIIEANKSAKTITDPVQKTMAYVAIATALATTAGVANGIKTNDVKFEAPNVVNIAYGKDSLKNNPATSNKKKEEAPAATAEPDELTEEWLEEVYGALLALTQYQKALR